MAMRRRLGAIGVLVALAVLGLVVSRSYHAVAQQPPAGGQMYEHHLNHQGTDRRFLVHVPKGYTGKERVAVVLAFHGGAATADSVERQSRLNAASDRFGFIVIYPEGTGIGRFHTWNAGSCCGMAVRQRVDDVGFVRKLLEGLPRHYAVDTRRVYATGFSNGAMLCHRLACEMWDRIVAIAPVSGDIGVEGPVPRRPVPVIQFHGMQDQNIPFQGGTGANALQPVPHRSIPSTVDWWVRTNHCQGQPVKVADTRDYVMKRYEPAAGTKGAPVVFYAVKEAGHTWPGGAEVGAHLNLGKVVASVDATTLMWEFFDRYRFAEPVASPAAPARPSTGGR